MSNSVLLKWVNFFVKLQNAFYSLIFSKTQNSFWLIVMRPVKSTIFSTKIINHNELCTFKPTKNQTLCREFSVSVRSVRMMISRKKVKTICFPNTTTNTMFVNEKQRWMFVRKKEEEAEKDKVQEIKVFVEFLNGRTVFETIVLCVGNTDVFVGLIQF